MFPAICMTLEDRRSNYPSLTLSETSGRDIDKVWDKLVNEAPGKFDPELTDINRRLEIIQSVLDNFAPVWGSKYDGGEVGYYEHLEDLTGRLENDLFAAYKAGMETSESISIAEKRKAASKAKTEFEREQKVLYGMVNNNKDLQNVVKAAQKYGSARPDAKYINQWNNRYERLNNEKAELRELIRAIKAQNRLDVKAAEQRGHEQGNLERGFMDTERMNKLAEKYDIKLNDMEQQRDAARQAAKDARAQGKTDAAEAYKRGREHGQLERGFIDETVINRLESRVERADERIKALREERDTKVAETRQYYQDMMQRQREGRKATEVRGRIRELVKKLNDKLFNQKEGDYVPQELTKMTVSVLEVINMDTWQAEQRIREIDAEMAKLDSSKANYSDKLQELIDKRRRYEVRDKKFKEVSAQLSQEYDNLKNDPKLKVVWDDVVAKNLKDMTAQVGNTPIKDMTNSQLELVYKTLKQLHHVIETAYKIRIAGEEKAFWEIAQEMTKEARGAKKINMSSNAAILANSYWYDMQRPQVIFERFGGYKKNSMWSKIYELFNEGQRAATSITMDLSSPFGKLVNSEAEMMRFTGRDKFSRIDKDALVDIGLVDKSGKEVMLTHDMLVSVYLDLLNDDNAKHLLEGGKTVPDLRDYYGRRAENGFGQKSVHAVLSDVYEGVRADRKQIAELEDKLRKSDDMVERQELKQTISDINAAIDENLSRAKTDLRSKIEGIVNKNAFDKQWIEATQELFDVKSKKYLDDVTLAIYGIEKAVVANYYPIVTDEAYRASDFATVMQNANLENAGFMKERVHSKSPTYLLGVSDMVSRQISKTAQYCGLMPAQRAFNKIWNKGEAGYSDSLKLAVRDQFGNYGGEWIENLIGDITGSRHNENGLIDRFFGALRGNLAQTTLTLNLRTAAAQTASYPAAAAVVGWSALRKGLTSGKVNTDLIAKYSPLWWYRMQGYSTAELGDIKDSNAFTAKVWRKLRWATGWIQAMDGLTTSRLWSAAEFYVADTMGVSRSAENFYPEVAKVFNKIIEETQPNYTTMQRPELLRNPSAIQKTFTMFMTQRLQNVSILTDAASRFKKYAADYKNGANGVTEKDVRQAKDTLIRAGISQVVATGMIVGIKTFVDMLMHSVNKYRDDDDELTGESMTGAVIDQAIDTVVGNLFLGSTVYSFAKAVANKGSWYDISLNGIDTLNDLLSDTVKLSQEAVKEDTDPAKLAQYRNKVAQDWCTMLGIPAPNAFKIVNAVRLHGEDIGNGEFWSFEAGTSRSTKQNVSRLLKAISADDLRNIDRITEELGGADKAASSVKTYTKKDYIAGDRSTEETRNILTGYLGMSDADAQSYIDYWDLLAIDKGYSDIISQSAYTKYIDKVKKTGLSVEDYAKALKDADADGNGSVSQDELGAYLKKLSKAGSMTTTQAEAVWDTKWDKTSYADWLKKNK